jgi:preprotein translocase subunit SecE
LTLGAAGDRKLAIVSGPLSDFRDEPNPQKNRWPVSSVKLGGGGEFYWIKQMAKVSPFKFMQEVRAEAQKVTWPTRKETTVTTIMVFVMVVITSLFFLAADQIMRIAVSFLLGINS